MENSDCGGQDLLKAQDTAVELYQLAALMLGNEEDALNLVEETVSQAEIDPCAAQDEAVEATRHQLIEAAVARMSQNDPEAFVAPAATSGSSSCIEGDDLSAAGISGEQLAELVGGAGRDQMRAWLDELPPAQRAIFVQRAVLSWDNGTTAATLRNASGERLGERSDWEAAQVSDLFRQALCSLASSLIQSAAVQSAAPFSRAGASL